MNVSAPTSSESEASLVDLYELLDISRDADAAQLRKRIAQLYLEAQDNIGHRNFRRRFYYQELFETHLPQAHHLLLNAERRAQYDAQLAERAANAPQNASQEDASTRTNANREAAEIEALRALLPTQEQLQEELQDDLVSSLEGDAAAQARAVEAIRNRPPRPPAPEWARMDAQRVEQRRDVKRRELIKQELMATGQRYGIVAGIGAALACAVVAFVFYLALPGEVGAPLFFYAIALIFIAGAAFLGARAASRQARRRVVAQLSQIPYEELLRRCGAR